jgi:hypothetical protein
MSRGAALAILLLPVALGWGGRSVRAQGEDAPQIQRGVQYLRGVAGTLRAGEAALAALAMIKAEVPANDPGLTACLSTVDRRFAGTVFTPELGAGQVAAGGPAIYEAAVIALMYVNLDPVTYRPRIEAVARYIMSGQRPNGCWDYVGRTAGDTSISQYAVLGLWECENGGVRVPPQVWDRAARWYLSSQGSDGGWNYHRDEAHYRDTISMTAAGVGSLLICQRQLAMARSAAQTINPLLTPVGTDANAPGRYRPETPVAAMNAGISRGIAWISSRFNPSAKEIMGQSAYYGLYGIERLGALGDRDTIGGVDWFTRGREFIAATQRGDGGWTDQHGDAPNTSWAILFLTRSTAKSLHRIEVKRLGAGMLLGGRGLPKDLSSLTVASGRVLARPMSGAVEGMLAVLEDPRAENADGALAGLIARYETEGPSVLEPFIPRFRKLLSDRDPGIRSAAAWSLGRTGRLDVAPDLIGALADSDETVVSQARAGLQILSRKIDGYGPPPGADEEARRAAAVRWMSWYREASRTEGVATDPTTTLPKPSAP